MTSGQSTQVSDPSEERCPPPSENHIHAFTWTNCYGQTEPGSRVYRFGIIETEDVRHFRIYSRRISWPKGIWTTLDMSRARSLELSACLKGICIPLDFEAKCESSIHDNNTLIVPRDGASVSLWWDSWSNPVFEALAPLWPFLSETREILKDHFAQNEETTNDFEL